VVKDMSATRMNQKQGKTKTSLSRYSDRKVDSGNCSKVVNMYPVGSQNLMDLLLTAQIKKSEDSMDRLLKPSRIAQW